MEKLHAYGGGTAQDFNLFPSSLLIKRTHIIQLTIMILKNRANVNYPSSIVNQFHRQFCCIHAIKIGIIK